MAVPAGCFWGVDSASPITKYSFEKVIDKAGQRPDFWGRYLAQYKLAPEEITVCRDFGRTRLLLIYNPPDIRSTVVNPGTPDPNMKYLDGLAEAEEHESQENQ